jgi:hypothetical protein
MEQHNAIPARYAGTVCERGNVNGCPRYPECGCVERLAERNKEANKRKGADSAEGGTK